MQQQSEKGKRERKWEELREKRNKLACRAPHVYTGVLQTTIIKRVCVCAFLWYQSYVVLSRNGEWKALSREPWATAAATAITFVVVRTAWCTADACECLVLSSAAVWYLGRVERNKKEKEKWKEKPSLRMATATRKRRKKTTARWRNGKRHSWELVCI